jgi:hypothetical protein
VKMRQVRTLLEQAKLVVSGQGDWLLPIEAAGDNTCPLSIEAVGSSGGRAVHAGAGAASPAATIGERGDGGLEGPEPEAAEPPGGSGSGGKSRTEPGAARAGARQAGSLHGCPQPEAEPCMAGTRST